ncbi:sugar phosphate isomerase/epimerase family protein [Tritonibacter mobilis]|uniref:sugar phosphate isomerase/epimerase family protein n=1 Tax=Tritonibacter mobilis TaxID=379347 RepID=UPI0008068844|nr:sugar phosphate isomerase/epimerase family protein [Tritonibacter mobilis]GLP86806.1 protein iolH [Tritonibacter mobilis]SDX66547.1 myo-inositol catabolism protein IolH [Tritonibacter mobilis]
MKYTLDPHMIRHLSLEDTIRKVAELGYDYVEMSPRPDFFSWWTRPKLYPERIQSFKKALKDHNVGLATIQPMYRWASPYADEWDMAIDNWKRAIEFAVELECPMFVSEFGRGGSPNRSLNDQSGIHRPEICEGQFFKAMDVLVPILEREGIKLSLEAHPEDWIEEIHPAIDIIKTINSPMVRASFIAPHTFFYGPDMEANLRVTAGLLEHVRLADTYDHNKSSELRYIVNPPESKVRVHQHLDYGEGEIDWDLFFKTLADLKFDGVLSNCVFGWEDRAEDSARFMLSETKRYVEKYGVGK